jgi:hypothetical protein
MTNNADVEMSMDQMEAVSGGFGPSLLINLAAAALVKGAGVVGGAAGWVAGGSSDPIPWKDIWAAS